MKYFVTGHTGFKGSWLVLLLRQMGHEVAGFSLEAEQNSLFRRAELKNLMADHFIGDVRDKSSLDESIRASNADVAIHFAAQPLVLDSYARPRETFEINVSGTLNFLEAWTSTAVNKPALVVTTDKVYKDTSKGSYTEVDELGGLDPYSASKSMADILSMSWRHVHHDLPLGIARAGNVIGAFDHGKNRLVPDIIRSLTDERPLTVRNSKAVRPWQHVLDCLFGYLLFLESLDRDGLDAEIALNFGPESSDFRTVEDVVNFAKVKLPSLQLNASHTPSGPVETQFLTLDSSKARSVLGWNPKYDFEKSLSLALEECGNEKNPRELVEHQIRSYLLEAES